MIRFMDERTVKRKTKRNREKVRLTKTRMVLRRFLTRFLHSNGRYFMGNLQEIIMLAGNRFIYQVIRNICNYYRRINGILSPLGDCVIMSF